ncbi:Universal stress protein family protein [Labrenzia sp. THAF191b]|uniref:universal stress protein n=1 Tax=Stappiaceae TaxID=2821832 RepID=UPI0012A8D794|nr:MULTISPECIES: universal stress protein [Stappiaceae]MCR9283333.1 universal stress protein [Paracoccaceae bacterium]MBO9421586.1 universal stress protein [Labrenzia sp. R4_2]QFS97250.1 Universal stress protein family protein [Labrenzia sp. THAF191b]QFT03565.1 Universal stress protein family protein [Labrenzia sp. THAF191a]QFT15107.1 Universal stress protein family protein [Labrenzia sp. THAF187b]
MTIKNILLVHSGTSGFPSSLRHASKIAAKHNAWLTGVYGSDISFFDQVLGLTEDLVKKLGVVRNAKIESSHELFEDVTNSLGLTDRAQFLMPETVGNLSLPEIARNFDFVVTGCQPKLPTDEFRAVSPDLLALQSGRPVLVVPDQFEAEQLGSHTLVAWDGKRAAARALNDAMNILEERPRKVSLLTVGDILPSFPEGTDIFTHLERHGVNVEKIACPKPTNSVAKTIQKTAAEIGAKLVVMGAYEHSKFSQDLFGGVTHELIRSTKVPVFMSH